MEKDRKMRINKKIAIMLVGFFIATLMLSLIVSAQYSPYVSRINSNGYSSYQNYQPSFSDFYSQRNINYQTFWPILSNRDQCEARQDFLIQILPGACTPSVVRSDLLEEQNVPVFCRLDAVKINPLIGVANIKSVGFKGGTSNGVAGISFHPSRAAVRVYDNLLGGPLLNNLGYVVVVLQRSKEADMPEYLETNLTAVIRYDMEKAFGVGRSRYYLPVLEDREWERNYKNYGFWKGKGYVRAEWIEENRVSLGLYTGRDVKLNSFILEKGQTSAFVYLPGFYCRAGVQFKLSDLSYPKTRIKLQVDDTELWIAEGEKFLDNKCKVLKIDSYAGNTIAKIHCPRKTFSLGLGIADIVKIEKNSDEKIVKVGEEVEAGSRDFLAFTGKYNDEKFAVVVKDVDPRFIDPIDNVILKSKRESIFSLLSKLVSDAEKSKRSTSELSKTIESKLGGTGESVGVIFLDSEVELEGDRYKFVGLEGVYDIDYSAEKYKGKGKLLQNYYSKVEESVKEIVDYYGSEKTGQGEYYGALALSQEAEVAGYLGKQETQKQILQALIENYAESKLAEEAGIKLVQLENYDYGGSGELVSVGFGQSFIRILDVRKPTIEEASAVFGITGEEQEKIVRVGEYIDSNETLRLEDLKDDEVKILRTYRDENKKIRKQTLRLNFEEPAANVGEGVIKLVNINLKKVAIVEVLPKMPDEVTETNFTVRIGIEKRAIQLAPDKTQEMIDNLDKTIEKWDKIVTNLGNVIRGWKGTCLATSTLLVAKNLFSNFGGKSLARQKVMRGDGGWYDYCTEQVSRGEYSTLDECFYKNGDKIETGVSEMENVISKSNAEIEKYSYKESHGIFGSSVQTEKSTNDYMENVFIPFINAEENKNKMIKINGQEKSIGEVFKDDATVRKMVSEGQLSWSEMRDTVTYGRLMDSSGRNAEIASNELNNRLGIIYNKALDVGVRARYDDLVSNTFPGASISRVESLGKLTYVNIFNIGEAKANEFDLETGPGKYVMLNTPGGLDIGIAGQSSRTEYSEKILLIPLDENQVGVGEYNNKKFGENKKYAAYLVDKTESGISKGAFVTSDDFERIRSKLNIGRFAEISPEMCKNKYLNPVVKYYETGNYRKMPAVVPLDTTNGWYAATKPITPGFGLKPYTDAGIVSSFWLCNVGKNGREEWRGGGSGDDAPCTMVNIDTGQPVDELPCLSKTAAVALVRKAINSLQEAASQYGRKSVSLPGGNFGVKAAVASAVGTQCQDFMSPQDCHILFNVCDPVLCPASRCNLGGAFQVDDVIQSGVVGSMFLCLPNIREGIVVPVCLTGIHAGLDSYVSILKSMRGCLQESLETGRQVGICDEIYSIYTCEFFWRQLAPIADVAIPKLIEFAYGQGARGGGEYLTVTDSWQNMENSVDYFTNQYAVNSFNAFKARSITEAGSEVCKMFMSTRFPNSKNLLDQLLEPDSPVQFHAWFDEIPYTEATVPATSQYKVYYHIYAGQDEGAYYSVYLANPPEAGYYASQPYVIVDSGYIKRGDYISETKDFTIPAGYKELCIRINTKEECGFKQVSTSFALDYVEDRYIKEQATQEIKTENECISGTTSILPLVHPNIQEGVQEAIDPAIYKRGIVRVCSSTNPGQGKNSGRWSQVGYCDDEKVGCWLDSESVKDVVKDLNIENQTLVEAQQIAIDLGLVDVFDEEESFIRLESVKEEKAKVLNEIRETEAYSFSEFDTNSFESSRVGSLIKNISEISEKAFSNQQRAEALFLKFEIYSELVKIYYEKSGLKEIVDKNQKLPKIPENLDELPGACEEQGGECKEVCGNDETELDSYECGDFNLRCCLVVEGGKETSVSEKKSEKVTSGQNLADLGLKKGEIEIAHLSKGFDYNLKSYILYLDNGVEYKTNVYILNNEIKFHRLGVDPKFGNVVEVDGEFVIKINPNHLTTTVKYDAGELTLRELDGAIIRDPFIVQAH